jgi:hypothetical protein
VNPIKKSHQRKWAAFLVVATLAAVIIAVPSIRQSLLRSIGWTLVTSEPLGPAEIIVVSLDSDGAGALEAADLVQSGIASRVAVFSDPPSAEDHEFIRRGLPYEDASARQIRQLSWLGVKDVQQIPVPFIGSGSAGEALQNWCDQEKIQSIVIVVTRDHSRRMRRVLERDMKGHSTRVTVRPSRYSRFDPDQWWHTREGSRIAFIELQKLILDIILHPTML